MDWRTLVYPFGFLSSLAFTGRFIVQWTTSEFHKKSMVTNFFWILSLVGNILLMFHAFIQVQFHVCLIQACNAVLAVRNLNLLKPQAMQWHLHSVIIALALASGTVTIAFIIQSYLAFDGEMLWIMAPHLPWKHLMEPSAILHLFGSLGIILFASRFWIQWWHAEKLQTSLLSPIFWWLSLSGALLSSMYFILLGDVVNAIGPSIGLIPYIRNLILIQRVKRKMIHERS